jgi:hypothetical protein
VTASPSNAAAPARRLSRRERSSAICFSAGDLLIEGWDLQQKGIICPYVFQSTGRLTD